MIRPKIFIIWGWVKRSILAVNDSYKIYLAKVGFLESGRYKTRPVIVVSEPHGEFDVAVAIPVSAQSSRVGIDVKLKDWQTSGLARQSVAWVHRLAAILGSDVVEEIGRLSFKDQTDIKKALRKLLNL